MSIGRRSILGSAALAPLAATAAAAQPAPNPRSTPETGKPEVWHFLTSAEVRALEALVSLVIPADELGPGAKEAGVVVFLDRQLGGAWGAGAHFYRSGPFQNGTPQQGYQLAFTPAEMFRTCLAKLDQSAAAQNGRSRLRRQLPRRAERDHASDVRRQVRSRPRVVERVLHRADRIGVRGLL